MKLHALRFFIFSFSLLIFVGCKNHFLLKGLRDTYFRGRTSPTINGYKQFHNRIVASGAPQQWDVSKHYNEAIMPDSWVQYLKIHETAAYLVIKNDSICYEKYFYGYSDTSHTNSWSMVKSIVSVLVGVAIREGKIKSVDERVSDFIPSYNIGLDTLLTIKDLLTMSSGIDFGESYTNPIGYAAKALYGSNILWLTEKYHCKIKPGSQYLYQSGNTELLGYIITKATGETLSEYASEKLWKQIGTGESAFWSLDHKNGMEKAFCCFNSNARDFARIGKLMLYSGKWNGQGIISMKYFLAATKGQTVPYYGYQWWIGRIGKHGVVYADGFSGQYIIVIPDENMIVVRLGQKGGHSDVRTYGLVALEMCGR